MRINSLTPRSAPLLTLLILIAGCAAGSRVAEEGYVHRYSLDEGMEIGFETVMDMSVDIDMPQLPIEGPIEATMTMLMKYEVEEIHRGEIRGALVIEDLGIEDMGGMLSQAAAALDQVMGVRIPVSMDERGRSEMLEVPEGLGDLDFSGMGFSGSLSSYFIPWPEGPVQPGHAWSDTVSMVQTRQGMDVDVRVITEYTYLGLQREEGVEDAPPAHKVNAVMSTTMGMGADVENASMIMSGSGSSEIAFYFDAGDGILIKAVGDYGMSMLMEIISPTEMTMPMDMAGSFVVRRRR